MLTAIIVSEPLNISQIAFGENYFFSETTNNIVELFMLFFLPCMGMGGKTYFWRLIFYIFISDLAGASKDTVVDIIFYIFISDLAGASKDTVVDIIFYIFISDLVGASKDTVVDIMGICKDTTDAVTITTK